MADRDRVPDRSRRSATSRSSELLDPGRAAALAARIDPRRAARPVAATNPPGGGTVYLGVGRRRGQRGQPDRVATTPASARASSTRRPASMYQNRGSYFSLDPDHPNVLEPGKRTLHTLLPGMLFRDGVGRSRGSWPASMGGDAQPQIHAQLVSALVDGGVDVWARPSPRRAGSSSRPRISSRRSRSASRPRHAPGVAEALEALGHPVTIRRAVRLGARPRARHRARRRRTGGRRRIAGRRDRPAQRRAAGRLVTRLGLDPCAILRAPVAGSAHTTPPPVRRPAQRPGGPRDLERRPELSLHERDRGRARPRRSRRWSPPARTSPAKLAAETTPLDANERWWVWKCPTPGCPGLLHVAGYAAEKPRGLRRLRRDLRQDLPALNEAVASRHPRSSRRQLADRRDRDRGLGGRVRLRLRPVGARGRLLDRSRPWR